MLNDDVLVCILSSWLSAIDLGGFDMAICNTESRTDLMSIYVHPGFLMGNFHDDLHSNFKGIMKWVESRSVKLCSICLNGTDVIAQQFPWDVDVSKIVSMYLFALHTENQINELHSKYIDILSSLRVLTIEAIHGSDFHAQLVHMFAQHCTKLQAIEFRRDEVDSYCSESLSLPFLSQNPSLTSLYLDCFVVSDATCDALSKYSPLLQKFTTGDVCDLSELCMKSIVNMIHNCPLLHSVHLRGDTENGHCMFDYCRKTKSILLGNYEDTDLHELFLLTLDLRKIVFHAITLPLSTGTVQLMANNNPKLTAVEFSDCNIYEDENANIKEIISHCVSVKMLRIAKDRYHDQEEEIISMNDLISLCVSHANLAVLSLSEVSTVTTDGIKQILSQSRLQALCVEQCKNVNLLEIVKFVRENALKVKLFRRCKTTECLKTCLSDRCEACFDDKLRLCALQKKRNERMRK